MKKMFGAAVLAGALAVPMATPSFAQRPIGVGNLVNIQIVRLIDDVTVTVEDVSVGVAAAANIAAALCDTVDLAALGAVVASGGSYTCNGTAGPAETILTFSR